VLEAHQFVVVALKLVVLQKEGLYVALKMVIRLNMKAA